MADSEPRWAELSARAQDLGAPSAERFEAQEALEKAIRTAIHTSAAPAVASEMLRLGVAEWAWRIPLIELISYVALGDLKSYADLAELLRDLFGKMKVMFALTDSFGSRGHPEWAHRVHDALYGKIKGLMGAFEELLSKSEGPETGAVLCRTKQVASASCAELSNDGGQRISGAAAIFGLILPFAAFPLARRAVMTTVIDGMLDSMIRALQDDPLGTANQYVQVVAPAYSAPACMADIDLSRRLLASGVLEAVVAYVQRARSSTVPPHAHVNRGVGQFVAAVASTAEGRERLLATQGIEDALMWLLQYGGDPIGIAENNTLADPRGMAGLSLALLRGREEDTQVSLPAKVVHQIVAMIDTYGLSFPPAVVLPYAQGLAELSVSDANKQHLSAIPGVIDSLQRGLGIGTPGSSTNDALQKLRTLSASTLAQLAAYELTLPLLLDHPVLEDLEHVPSLSESSKDAQAAAMAVLFAVHQHEKAKACTAEGATSSPQKIERRAQGGHIMLSYEWSVQPVIKRIRDSLMRRGYRVWLDVSIYRRACPVAATSTCGNWSAV
eukprot:SAG31_NODE_3321_length_4417_cov_2.056508_5_plen_555_part_00